MLVIKGLSNADQCEILCRFDTFNISMDNLNKFLLTLTSVASNNTNNQQSINAIAKNKVTSCEFKRPVKTVANTANIMNRAASPLASIKNNLCSRCGSSQSPHLDL